MKSIYNKLEIKLDLLIIFFLAFISGLFKDMLFFFLVIFIHEMGHITTSLLYKWKINKVSFGICGGFITYDENIDKSFKEEFLISISGFLFQIIFYLLSYFFYKENILSIRNMVLIEKYTYSVILFNILPIIPLDGSKILNIVLNIFFSYKKSLKITSFISFIIVILLLNYFIFFSIKMEFSYIMIFIFLIKKIYLFYKDIPYLFNKFLFERYSKPVKYKKLNIIKGYNLNKFKRQKENKFLIEKKLYKERQILSKIFD